MAAKANYFKIGLFVVIGAALGIISIAVLGAGSLFQKTITLETYIDGSVQGLDVGSAVKFRGVTIGKVSEIAVVSWEYDTSYAYILVRTVFPEGQAWFKSEKETKSMLEKEAAKGLRVRLATPGVTGTAFLEVDYLDPERHPPLKLDWTPKYPYLPSAPSYITQLSDSLARIMNSLEEINLLGITTRLEKTLDTMTVTMQNANISGLSSEANQLLAELRETNRGLHALLGGEKPEKLLDEAIGTAASARRLVESAEKPFLNLMTSLDETTVSVRNLAKNLDSTSNQIPKAMAQLRSTLRRMDEVIAVPQEQLPETIENFRFFSKYIKELAENSKKYPSYLLFGDPPNPIRPGGRQ